MANKAQPAHAHPSSVRRTPSTVVAATAESDIGRAASRCQRWGARAWRATNAPPSTAHEPAVNTSSPHDSTDCPAPRIDTEMMPVAITAAPAPHLTSPRVHVG
jgi:hypothetical protein